MNRKKLIICGDSWLAPIPADGPSEHFSYRLGNLIDYDVVAFSRAGSSNKGICLQVESAIKQNPDLIILNTTNVERTEIVFKSLHNKTNVTHLSHPFSDVIKNEMGRYDPRIVSSGIPDLLETDWQYFKSISNGLTDKIIASKKEALKYYLTELYDREWAIKVDTWCFLGILNLLEHSTIPYLIIMDKLDLKSACTWISEKNITLPWKYWFDITKKNIADWEEKNNRKFDEPSWHTLDSDQSVMIDIIYKHLIKHNLI